MIMDYYYTIMISMKISDNDTKLKFGHEQNNDILQ